MALCSTRFVTSHLAVALALPRGATGLMKVPKEVVAASQSGTACLFARKMRVTDVNVDVSVDRPALLLPLCSASAAQERDSHSGHDI